MSVDFSRENLSSLLKDGVTDDLFKLLWARDELNFSPMVNVPDTILYKYGQPVCWYFTSVNGHVKRKNKQNLISAKIEEAFNKHILGYDVIAYFISMPVVDHDSSNNNNSTSQPQEAAPTVIEYLDREALKNFLYNHRKDVNGILQRFIEPKSTRNEIIRGIWSPKLCLLERAENIHELHDRRYGLYERCVVYEGPDYYFTSAPLRGPVLSGQIQKHCESIVSHIGEVTFGQKQITRIVLNFKVDSRDKIWLLYSTSIRCVDMLEYNPSSSLFGGTERARSLLNIDSVISLSDKVHLNPKKSYDKIQPRIRKPCLSCSKEELEEMRHPITYKCIIKHYDHVVHLMKRSTSPTKRAAASRNGSKSSDEVVMWPPDQELVDAAGGVGFGCLDQGDDSHNKHQKLKFLKDLQVPPIIATLHPKLNSDTYVRCKDDPLFLNKTVHVCEACYLVFAEFQTLLLRMGQNLTKLLTPDPVINTTLVKKGDNRPSSADWRAISSAVSQASQTRSVSAEDSYRNSVSTAALRRQEEAQARAIGIRTSDSRTQPNFPTSIRNPNDSQEVLYNQYDEYSTTAHSQPGATHAPFSPNNSHYGITSAASMQSSVTPFKGGLLEGDSQSASSTVYDANDVHAMIADRERRFFKEISLNPQLKDQHPLMHLISAQQKLKLVDQQSGVLMSKTASKSASVFGTKYGKQPGDQYDKYGPYNVELPFTVNGEIIKPSDYRARKHEKARKKKEQRQKSLQSFMMKDDDGDEGSSKGPNKKSTAGNSNSIAAAIAAATKAAENSTTTSAATTAIVDPNKTNTVMDNNIKSSKKYREFLSDSLKKIQSDVEGAAPFKRTNNMNAAVDEHGFTQQSAPVAESNDRKIASSQDKSKNKRGPSSSSTPVVSSVSPTSTASNSPEKSVASTSAHQAIPPKHVPMSEKLRNKEGINAPVKEIIPTPPELPSSKRSTSLSDEQAPTFGNEASNSYITDHSSTDAPLLPIVNDDETPAVTTSSKSNKISFAGDNENVEQQDSSTTPQVVSGHMLEEDSAVMIQGGSQEKADGDHLDTGEDGFSISQSEAPQEDQGSIGSLDESAGLSLEMNSVEIQDAASSSLFLSPDNNRDNVMDRKSFQESVAKEFAADQSLIREQAEALLNSESTVPPRQQDDDEDE